MSNHIKGITLIEHNISGIEIPDDPTYGPFLLEVHLNVPEFMEMQWIFLCGGEERVKVRGKTIEALEQFLTLNEIVTHPRLMKWTIRNTEG